MGLLPEFGVMQAPVGPATSTGLVAAVSGAGGLGTLAASWTSPAELREQVGWLCSVLNAPFCVNLVLAFDQRDRLRAAVGAGAPAVSFSWGVDRELIGMARSAGAYVFVQVGGEQEAAAAVAAGADALIVQGVEAGGHVQAERPLLELLPAVRGLVRVPLVGAGGVADVGSVTAALDAGADAVAGGTVFLAAEEADVHPAYLDRLISAGAADTVLTTCFDRGWPGAPHRVIRNTTVEAWTTAGEPGQDARPGEGETVATRNGRPVLRYADAQPTRQTTGDIEAMAMYAGTSVRAITQSEPAADIVARLAKTTN